MTGGTDFVSAIVHKHHPNRPFFGMSFAINSAIAIVSYFVYGCQMEPVILCILYSPPQVQRGMPSESRMYSGG